MKNIHIFLLLFMGVMFLNIVETIDLIEGETPSVKVANALQVTREIKLLAHLIMMLDDEVHFAPGEARIRSVNKSNQMSVRRGKLDSVTEHLGNAVAKIVNAFKSISWSWDDDDDDDDDNYDDDDEDNDDNDNDDDDDDEGDGDNDNTDNLSVINIKAALSVVEPDNGLTYSSTAMAELETIVKNEDVLINALSTNNETVMAQALENLASELEEDEETNGAVDTISLAEELKLMRDLETFEALLEANEEILGHHIPPLDETGDPEGSARPDETGIPEGSAPPDETGIPKGSAPPDETGMPKGSAPPDETGIPKCSAPPDEIGIPKGSEYFRCLEYKVLREEEVILANEDALFHALVSNNKDNLADVLGDVGSQIDNVRIRDKKKHSRKTLKNNE